MLQRTPEQVSADYRVAISELHPKLKVALEGADPNAAWVGLVTLAYGLFRGNGVGGGYFLEAVSTLVSAMDDAAGRHTGVVIIRDVKD